MNDELGRMRQEAVVACFNVSSQNLPGGTEIVIQSGQLVHGMRFEPEKYGI